MAKNKVNYPWGTIWTRAPLKTKIGAREIFELFLLLWTVLISVNNMIRNVIVDLAYQNFSDILKYWQIMIKLNWKQRKHNFNVCSYDILFTLHFDHIIWDLWIWTVLIRQMFKGLINSNFTAYICQISLIFTRYQNNGNMVSTRTTN